MQAASRQARIELAQALMERARRARQNRLKYYQPYEKQREFHAAGKSYRERLFSAGNQLGKTWAGSFETAMHLTGRYPDWWEGRTFDKATVGWAASVSAAATRDGVQRLLFGRPGIDSELGTAAIPRDAIKDIAPLSGVANAYALAVIKHGGGGDVQAGESMLGFRNYEQGRAKFQVETLDFCIAEGQGVQMADGRYIPIEQVEPGMVVRTVNGRGQPVDRKVVAVHDKGVQPIVELRMSRGPWLRLTPDHEVYETTRSKVRADQAKRIVQLPGPWEPSGAIESLDDAYFAWAGLVVAEGSVSCRKITMADCEAVRAAIDLLPADAKVRRKDFNPRHRHVPDWFLSWPPFWGRIEGGKAHQKTVPEWVFTAPNRQVRLFLSYLFAGDGWASRHCIGYGTTSRHLAEHVSTLLARLGVRSTVVNVPPKNINWREQWHVLICSIRAVIRFADEIGIIGKELAVEKVRREAKQREQRKSAGSRHLKKADANPDMVAFYRERNHRNRDRFSSVRSVTPAGESRVYDLSIETDHRFVVGTSVVSNCWLDEEPPHDIYMEALTRTNTTLGPVYMTFTPLMGMSETVMRFLVDEHTGTTVVFMGVYDAGHLTREQADAIVASYPEHEREARAFGKPVLGSGAVYPIPESEITIPGFSIPDEWPRICGMDIGWDHPTAAIWMAHNRDADVIYVYDAYKRAKQIPAVHASAIKARGAWIPVAWPSDALQAQKDSGKPMRDEYIAEGVAMLPERAQWEDGSIGVEPGLQIILNRMSTGRFKVFAGLEDWFSEYRIYHRKDGVVVKKMDDAMDATRYGVMMLRYAKAQTLSTFEPFRESWRG